MTQPCDCPSTPLPVPGDGGAAYRSTTCSTTTGRRRTCTGLWHTRFLKVIWNAGGPSVIQTERSNSQRGRQRTSTATPATARTRGSSALRGRSASTGPSASSYGTSSL